MSNSGMPGVPGRPWKYAVASPCGYERHGSVSSVNWLPKNAACPCEAVRRRESPTRTPSRLATRPSSNSSCSMTQPAPSPTSKSRERGCQRRVTAAATGRRILLTRTGTHVLVETEQHEIAVDDLGERGKRDARLPALVFVDQAVE